MGVAAKNTNIPLAGHWLPEDTFNSPLDGSFPLFRQLQKLQPEFLEYEQLAKMYKAQPPKSRRASKENKTARAITLSKSLVDGMFMSLRRVAIADASVYAYMAHVAYKLQTQTQ